MSQRVHVGALLATFTVVATHCTFLSRLGTLRERAVAKYSEEYTEQPAFYAADDVAVVVRSLEDPLGYDVEASRKSVGARSAGPDSGTRN